MSLKLLVALGGAVGIVLLSFVYFLIVLPLVALFRRPIESVGECPLCGSRDFRPAHLVSLMDRVRKLIGLYPFRCRGCTRRFISRTRRDVEVGAWFETGVDSRRVPNPE